MGSCLAETSILQGCKYQLAAENGDKCDLKFQ